MFFPRYNFLFFIFLPLKKYLATKRKQRKKTLNFKFTHGQLRTNSKRDTRKTEKFFKKIYLKLNFHSYG